MYRNTNVIAATSLQSTIIGVQQPKSLAPTLQARKIAGTGGFSDHNRRWLTPKPPAATAKKVVEDDAEASEEDDSGEWPTSLY